MNKLPGIAIGVDVENLLIASAFAGQGFKGYSLEAGFENMFSWIRTFANIICVYLYIPIGQCSKNDEIFQRLWEKYKDKFIFEIIYCPKKRKGGILVDDVDQHLIDHTKKIIELMWTEIEYFCLASGDLDYSSLLWHLKRKENLKISFIIGDENSFSKVYRQMRIADIHPKTGKELIHCFLPREE